MKKFWIGEGITILLIIIANITAHKLASDRAVPISVFSACLCLFILMVPVIIVLCKFTFEHVKQENRKGKRDISGTIVIALLGLVFLGTSVGMGIRGTRAMKDIINGPIEQPVYKTSLKDRRESNGYRSRTTNYYLICRTYDEKNKPLEVKVNKSKLDDVKDARVDGFALYGFEDKYILRYFENLKILFDLQVLEQDPE